MLLPDVSQVWRVICLSLPHRPLASRNVIFAHLQTDPLLTYVHAQLVLLNKQAAGKHKWVTLTFDLAIRWAFRWAKP